MNLASNFLNSANRASINRWRIKQSRTIWVVMMTNLNLVIVFAASVNSFSRICNCFVCLIYDLLYFSEFRFVSVVSEHDSVRRSVERAPTTHNCELLIYE